jgi:hypothetical protein
MSRESLRSAGRCKTAAALVLDELLSYQRVPSSYHMIPEESLQSRPGGLLLLAGGGRCHRPAAAAVGSRSAVGRSEGPRTVLDARRRAPWDVAERPRQRPVRGRVQGPGRGAEGEAVPPPFAAVPAERVAAT